MPKNRQDKGTLSTNRIDNESNDVSSNCFARTETKLFIFKRVLPYSTTTSTTTTTTTPSCRVAETGRLFPCLDASACAALTRVRGSCSAGRLNTRYTGRWASRSAKPHYRLGLSSDSSSALPVSHVPWGWERGAHYNSFTNKHNLAFSQKHSAAQLPFPVVA